MKTLKFFSNLVPLIESGVKTTTWRLFDDKELTMGDELLFIEKESGRKFGSAKITSIVVRTLGTLKPEDWEGHERYSSEAAMYEAYQKCYGKAVGPDSEVKIITFCFSPKFSLVP